MQATKELTRKLRPNGERAPIQSLDRGLIILEAVAKADRAVRLAELRQVLGLHHSSVFRLADTLRRRGFLACPHGSKDYVLGPAIWRLARDYDWGKMLALVAHEQLQLLARETGETAHLAVRKGRQALFVDHVTADHPLVVTGRTGELVPLHCTAHGKALLADFSERQLVALMGPGPLKAMTQKTIVSLRELAAACEQIRARGFATDDGEFLDGIRCVAAPIRDRGGVVMASIGISAPLTRFPESRYQECGELVRKIALHLGEQLSDGTDGLEAQRKRRGAEERNRSGKEGESYEKPIK